MQNTPRYTPGHLIKASGQFPWSLDTGDDQCDRGTSGEGFLEREGAEELLRNDHQIRRKKELRRM